VNLQLFELLNHWAGRSDGVDDVMEFLAQWLIYGVFAVAAVLAGRALRRRQFAALLQVAVAPDDRLRDRGGAVGDQPSVAPVPDPPRHGSRGSGPASTIRTTSWSAP